MIVTRMPSVPTSVASDSCHTDLCRRHITRPTSPVEHPLVDRRLSDALLRRQLVGYAGQYARAEVECPLDPEGHGYRSGTRGCLRLRTRAGERDRARSGFLQQRHGAGDVACAARVLLVQADELDHLESGVAVSSSAQTDPEAAEVHQRLVCFTVLA
jgi:hypothetical protein